MKTKKTIAFLGLIVIALSVSHELTTAKQGSGGVPSATETTTEDTIVRVPSREPVTEEQPEPTPEPVAKEEPAPTTTEEPATVVEEETTEEPTPTPKVTTTEVEESAPAAEVAPPVQSSAPAVQPTTTTTVQPTVAPVEEEELLCYERDDLRERIACRLNKSKEELASEPYSPEGCRWGSDTWQAKCQERYTAIYPCYEQPVGPSRIGCIKDELGLPTVLKSIDTECGDDEDCRTTYRSNVHHLIVARLYDAEERVEDWYEAGRLNQETTAEFVAFISEQKWAFYEAESKEERKDVLRAVQAEWDTVITKLSPAA